MHETKTAGTSDTTKDYAQNPQTLFLTLSRYKIKDNYATTQMLDHAMSVMPGKGFTLHELKNLMISSEGRPRVDVFQKVRLHFAATGLDRTAINTIYSHVLNPMIASRSYMCIEPIELWLDIRALRTGLVVPVDPDTDPSALLLQDSGMVPVSTQIAIVNPETCRLCHIGEYGEIWVQSEACVKSFYGSKDAFDAERFNGRTVDGDPHVTYVRTGDLGFLHNVSRPIGPGGAQVEMQILFVLGAIGETFEVNGLSHFPMDIENSIEKCHRNIVPGGSAVFQAGGLVVVLVEVIRKAYLASIVPVIVNSILNEHQIVVDIIAFVSKGDFPRSRLGEKQRGKILASWVTRKMRTIAQFSIKDGDGSEAQGTENAESRGGIAPAGVASGLGNPSSLKHAEISPALMEQQMLEIQQQQQEQLNQLNDYAPLPTGISELPTHYDDSILETPPAEETETMRSDDTPTQSRTNHAELLMDEQDGPHHNGISQQYGSYDDPILQHGGDIDEHPPEPRYNTKPILTLPSVTGRETLDSGAHLNQPGGLRAINISEEDEDYWPQEAIMHMNLSSSNGSTSRGNHYDGSEYGNAM